MHIPIGNGFLVHIRQKFGAFAHFGDDYAKFFLSGASITTVVSGNIASKTTREQVESRIRTNVATIRMQEDRIRSLRIEATKERLNMNALVNRIIATYLDYHKPASETQMMYFPKKAIISMLSDVTEEHLDYLSKIIESEINDLIYIKGEQNDEEAVLKGLMTWMKESQFFVTDSFYGNKRIIVVKHDMGTGMSLLVSKCLSDLMKGENKHLSIETREGSFIISVDQ